VTEPASRVRVLVVDDDVPTRVGITAILSSEPDLEVVGEAATAGEAAHLVGREEPDVVLMDVRLPDADGIEATRRMLARGSTEHRPPRVIILTTFDVPEYAFDALRAGASAFLLKRARAEELIEAVRAVARGASWPLPRVSRSVASRGHDVDHPNVAALRQLEQLTDREAEVLTLLARGLTNQEIASELVLSTETVKTHVKHVYAKLGARDRVQAALTAYEGGLVARPPRPF